VAPAAIRGALKRVRAEDGTDRSFDLAIDPTSAGRSTAPPPGSR
jgi:hypothetical protein